MNALNDLNSVINIDSAQPDNYVKRGMLFAQMEKWDDAIKDLNRAIDSDDYKTDAMAYYYRALCFAYSGNIVSARKDVQTAYNLADDPELEKTLQDLWQKLY